MLWSKSDSFTIHPFETEADFEKAITECSEPLFGPKRVYVDTKKKIGLKGKTQNIPDGYLIDLASVQPRKSSMRKTWNGLLGSQQVRSRISRDLHSMSECNRGSLKPGHRVAGV